MMVVYYCSAPSREAHDLQVTQLKTQLGSTEWHRYMATQGWIADISKILSLFSNLQVLTHIGFSTPDYPMSSDLPEAVAEYELAQFLLEFALAQIGSAILFGQTYSHGLPGCFGALNSPHPEEKQSMLKYLRSVWDMLCKFETLAMENTFISGLLVSMMWPQNQWIHEVLLGAAENDFGSLPTVLEQEVRDTFRCLKSTKIVEDFGNKLRASERQHSASKLGRVSRWHQLVHSNLVEENDMRQVSPDAPDAIKAPSVLSKASFVCDKSKFSLGNETYNDFLEKQKVWHSPAPEFLSDCVFLTRSALLAWESPQRLQDAWIGLLCTRGTVLHMEGDDSGQTGGLVVHVSDHSVVVLQVYAHKSGDLGHFSLQKLGCETKYRHLLVDDWKGWWVRDITAHPPAMLHEPFAANGFIRPAGIVFTPSLVASNLLRHAAREAFPNMNLSRLKQLLNLIPDIGFGARRRPTTELDTVQWLAAHILEVDLNNSDILDPILAKRKCKSGRRFATSFSAADVDLADGILNTEDTTAIRKTISVESAHCEAEKAARGKAKAARVAKAGGAAGSGAGPSRPRLMELQGGADVDLAFARGYMPVLKGATLVKDTTYHMRFISHYPTVAPPRMCSKAWNAKITQWAAVCHCLLWVSTEHTQATDERCPYDFAAWACPEA